MRSAPLLLLPLLLAASCGYVGDPLPPALNIPERISDLTAIEVGDRIEIEFTLPSLTTEGLVLKTLGSVDLRVGKSPAPFDTDRWAESARIVETSFTEMGRVKKVLKAKEWAGQELVIGVRTINAKGRSSGWSNLVTLRVIDPLEKPVVTATSDAEGARLQWTGNAPAYRLFRQGPNDPDLQPFAEVSGAGFLDRAAAYGTKYVYAVVGFNHEVQSDRSEPVAFIPEDTFPPSAPAGLKAIAGVNTVELIWDRVPETDLRGYRVFRSVEGGDFERIAELVEVPSFRDQAPPESGKKCRYAITAVDIRGNEGARSAIIEITAP